MKLKLHWMPEAGVHVGRVRVRRSGSFRIGKIDGISWRHCRLLQRTDGYEYEWQEGVYPNDSTDVTTTSACL
jgi:hypothetical protein